jgi:uncharacterized protein
MKLNSQLNSISRVFLLDSEDCISLLPFNSSAIARTLLPAIIMSKYSYRVFLTVPVLALLVACGGTRQFDESEIIREITEEALGVDSLLRLSRSSQRPESEAYLISAMEMLLLQDNPDRAAELFTNLNNPETLPGNLQLRIALLGARLAMDSGNATAALRWLTGGLVANATSEDIALQQQFWILRSDVYRAAGRLGEGIQDLIRLNAGNEVEDSHEIRNTIWRLLESLDLDDLSDLTSAADTYEYRGWLELARRVNAEQDSIKAQVDAIRQWQTVWTQHSAHADLPSGLAELQNIWEARPRRIALLLPLQDPVGRAVQEGFLSAYYAALNDGDEVPRIDVLDTSTLLLPGAQINIYGLYDTAVAAGADLVIGPLDKDLVRQLHSMERLPVPTLALNYTDLDYRNSSNFFQFGLAPEDEIRKAADLAWQSGHRSVALLSPPSPDYQRLQSTFASYWQSLGGEVVSRSSFSGEAEYSNIIKTLLAVDASEARAAAILRLLPRSEMEFTPRRRQDIDFIFLIANPRQGRQIKPTLGFYFADDIPVYALSAIYDGLENQLSNRDLNGIIFTDVPWVLRNDDALKQQVNANLRMTQGPLQRLRALGIDSFRLYPRLQQLGNKEISSLDGVTGILTMTDFGSIQRRPESATFVDGLVRILEPVEIARND